MAHIDEQPYLLFIDLLLLFLEGNLKPAGLPVYDTGYYDLMRWTSKQKGDGDIIMLVYDNLDIRTVDTNNVIMCEAGALPMFFQSCKSVKGYDFLETDKSSVSGNKSAYVIKLDCDGDRGCTAVFDKNDNLLNIVTTDDFNGYVSSNFFD